MKRWTAVGSRQANGNSNFTLSHWPGELLNGSRESAPPPTTVQISLKNISRKAALAAERKAILDHSFRHWREHSPYLKSQLALTLGRMGRRADASLVFASVMDSASLGSTSVSADAQCERCGLGTA